LQVPLNQTQLHCTLGRQERPAFGAGDRVSSRNVSDGGDCPRMRVGKRAEKALACASALPDVELVDAFFTLVCAKIAFVIAEIVPGAYDGVGRRVTAAYFHRNAHGSLPIGRYVSHPLTIHCGSIADVRQFLAQCRGVSPLDLFGKYRWQPPEDFERLKKGGCVDFSLWTWRQLLALGYDARFVGGKHGRYGIGHAWVEYFEDGKCFLVEPQLSRAGKRIPRLSTVRYVPKVSVAQDGEKLAYFAHQQTDFNPEWRLLLPLVLEWLAFWTLFWLKALPRFPLLLRRLWNRKS
jgi:hypothetical protein